MNGPPGEADQPAAARPPEWSAAFDLRGLEAVGAQQPPGQVSLTDVLAHIDRALRGMAVTIETLGDELVNALPAVPGANSACVLVTHCLGVVEFWAGQVIAGREVQRDRDAEFTATSTVAELRSAMAAQRARLTDDLVGFDGQAPPRGPLDDRDREDMPEFVGTQGGVLLHVYEELAQHRGHLDLTADLVREGGSGRD